MLLPRAVAPSLAHPTGDPFKFSEKGIDDLRTVRLPRAWPATTSRTAALIRVFYRVEFAGIFPGKTLWGLLWVDWLKMVGNCG
jgi:hypothetical protein